MRPSANYDSEDYAMTCESKSLGSNSICNTMKTENLKNLQGYSSKGSNLTSIATPKGSINLPTSSMNQFGHFQTEI